MTEVSLILPCYNEEVRLSNFFFNFGVPENWEILVAADGCTDNTEKVAVEYGARVISDSKRLGKGKALYHAATFARGDVIVVCDVDYAYPKWIKAAVQYFESEKLDVFCGKRQFAEGRPFYRKLQSRLFHGLAELLFNKLPDTQCCLKVFRKDVFLSVMKDVKTTGYAWDVEFIVRAKEKGCKIDSAEVFDKHNAESKVKFSDSFSMAADLGKFWLRDRVNMLTFLLLLLVFVSGLAASVATAQPIGADYYFHLDVAEVWAAGGNGMFSDVVFQVNNFPYPPLFHFLLVPSVWLGQPYLFARVLQTVLFFCCFAAVVLLMRRTAGKTAALVTGVLLISSMAYVDATLQARVQSLEMLLIPLTLLMFVELKNTKFALLTGALTWNHGAYGLSAYWSLLLQGVGRKKWWKTMLLAVVLAAPIIVVSVVYAQGALSTWSGHTETWQEYMMFTNPMAIIPLYAGASLAGWLFLFPIIFRWKKASELQKSLVLMTVGMMPILIPLVADRFLQYATVPLCCLAGIGISKHKSRLTAFMPFIVMAFVIYQLNFWWITFTNNWWTP